MNIKDFCKWLGVSEKIAKLVIWLFIGMCFLIVTNIMLESIGLPYYKITVDNLTNERFSGFWLFLSSSLLSILNFYSVVLLVFRTSETKRIFKYALLYLALNLIFVNLFSDETIANAFLQVFIFLYLLFFFYLYSGEVKKYILYGICSYVTNVFVQFICYLYKLRFVDFSNINQIDKFLTSFDFLIIMYTIIFIKEIIVKKKKEVK